MHLYFFFVCLLVASVQKSFTAIAPDENGGQADQEIIDEVQQLENLHKEANKSSSVVNQLKQETIPRPEQKSSDGDASPQTNSRSAIFRHRGITQAKKNKAWKSDFSEYVRFSPSDLAAYVFRTGDEEGVAVAVEELVREGVMGRTDAINYLQDVKQELAYMKEQYEQQRKLQEIRDRMYKKPQLTQKLLSLPREEFVAALDAEKREPKVAEQALVYSTTTEQHQQMVTASTPAPKLSTHSAGVASRPKVAGKAPQDVSEPPANSNMKRQHADKIPAGIAYHDEFALEEVIYQLAKNMFTQSILRGDQTAEDTLSWLVPFMEGEVGKKSISSQMKEKILEIVSAALVDSLRDYQKLLPEEQSSILNETGPYKKQADAKGKHTMQNAFSKLNAAGQRNSHQSPSNDNGQKPS